jgi:glycogen(starch) synthase
LCESFWPRIGGAEIFVQALASSQAEAGHGVAILVNRLDHHAVPPGLPPGIEIHRVRSDQAVRHNDIALLGRLAREVAALKRNFRPDVIHVHSDGFMPWLHVLTLGASPAPTVVTLHTPRANMQLPHPILDRLLSSASRVVGVSEATRQEWEKIHGSLLDRAEVILNGIVLRTETPRPLDFDSPTLLCLGRVDAVKGLDVALRAFARLAPDWPAARLVIAGDGPARAELEALAAELNLAPPRVVFRGWVAPEAVAAEINAAAVVLMPSRWEEPFGLVAVETALMGRPLVASRLGGLREIVRDGETGLLVPPEDPAALADATVSLLREPERARAIGAAARARAQTFFTMERCATDYERLYHSLVAARGHQPCA